MSDPVKFLFNYNFDKKKEEEREAAEKRIKDELRADFDIELEEVRKKAFEEGLNRGRQEAMSSNDVALRRSNEEMNSINEKLQTTILKLLSGEKFMQEEFRRRLSEYREQAIRISVLTAKKIAGEMIRRQPLDDLEKMFSETLDYMDSEIRVFVSVPEELVKHAGEKLKYIASAIGYTGNVIVVPDREMKAGDWKIEWGAGGLLHRINHVEELIEDSVKRYLSGVGVEMSTKPEKYLESSVLNQVPASSENTLGQGDNK